MKNTKLMINGIVVSTFQMNVPPTAFQLQFKGDLKLNSIFIANGILVCSHHTKELSARLQRYMDVVINGLFCDGAEIRLEQRNENGLRQGWPGEMGKLAGLKNL